jgi:uncharacterized membrane protein YgcG
MANNIDFNVNSNAVTVLNQTADAAENTAKGFTSAKAELRALTQQLLQMDSASEEFKKASARAAELKDNIGDLSAEISANAGNAFEGLSNNVGLFGSRLMDLDLKGAGQALTGVGNAVSRIDFKTLKDEVAGLAKGFGDLAFSVVANPYILLGTAVVALGYTFREELLAPITDTIKANDRLRESIQFTSEEITAAAGEEVKQIAKLEELKFALNDATTSTEKRKQAVKELQKINPVYFKDLDAEKTKYNDLNTQIDSYVKGLVAQSLAKAASARIEQESAKFLDEQIQRQQKLANETARLAQEQATLADKSKAVEESGTNIFGGKSYGAGYERAKVTAAATGDMIFQLEREIQALNESEVASKAAYEQRVADLLNFKKLQEEIAAGFGVTPPPPPKEKKEKKPAEVKREELGEVYDMEVSWNLRIVDEEQLKQDKLNAIALQGHKTRLIFTEEYKNAVIAADNQLYQARWALANASVDLLATLFQKNKKAADVAFVLQKALAIGQIVVDTQREIAGYWANPTWKLSPDGGVTLATTASTAAKLRAAASIATIAGTTIGKFMGGGSANVSSGGGTSGGGGGMAAPSPANFAFVANQPNQQPPLQAYVVSTQVSSNLEAQQLINNQARLGG